MQCVKVSVIAHKTGLTEGHKVRFVPSGIIQFSAKGDVFVSLCFYLSPAASTQNRD